MKDGETGYRIYEVEARSPQSELNGQWVVVRVIATDGELALAAAIPLAAKFLNTDPSRISVRCGTPAYKVDAFVGMIPR